MTKQGTWLEQWERVQRYYNRIKEITEGITPTSRGAPEFNFADEFYAFFIFCYHLKDWIDLDGTLKLKGKIADKFVRKNECLKMCGDICNGIKHLKLHKSERMTAKFEKESKISYDIKNGMVESIKADIFISTDKVRINAFDLATDCMDRWKYFIKENIVSKN